MNESLIAILLKFELEEDKRLSGQLPIYIAKLGNERNRNGRDELGRSRGRVCILVSPWDGTNYQ